jgi:hypothetical protein
MEELELQSEDQIDLQKHWQWLYKTRNSPLWEITSFYATKEEFLTIMEKTLIDVEHFCKAKITKIKV